MTKINFKAIGSLVLMLVSGGFILYELYLLIVLPMINKTVAGLTILGTLSMMLAVTVFIRSGEYVISRFKAIK